MDRRRFLGQFGAGLAVLGAPGAFAEALTRTPRQYEGPFYPDKLPLDTDNDLLIINDSMSPALGEVTYLSGRVLDTQGNPVRNAVVSIWQCDSNGIYLHSEGGDHTKIDRNFQGYGRFLTGSSGEYLFRTIKPVPYGWRTAHIHFKLWRAGRHLLTTQCYVKGHPQNARDGIWGDLSEATRALVTVDFAPLAGAQAGELAARFDLVVGVTPDA